MKKVLALAIALAAIAAGYGFYLWYPGGPMQLRIATEGAYPPFNAIDKDGNLVGFDVDIANALCDHMHASCTIEAQAWDGIIPGLLDRKYDAIVASMSITEKRREQVNFTDKYYSTSARFVAKKEAKIEISDAGLAGKRVGVQRATVYEAYLRAKADTCCIGSTRTSRVRIRLFDKPHHHPHHSLGFEPLLARVGVER